MVALKAKKINKILDKRKKYKSEEEYSFSV